MLLRHPEQLSDKLGPVTQVLLDELGPHHPQEGRRGLVGNGLGQQGLTFKSRKKTLNIRKDRTRGNK